VGLTGDDLLEADGDQPVDREGLADREMLDVLRVPDVGQPTPIGNGWANHTLAVN
jgi:hypothetical protein